MSICYNTVCSPAALSHELQQLLVPVTYCAEHGVVLTKSSPLGSPIKVSHQPIPKDAGIQMAPAKDHWHLGELWPTNHKLTVSGQKMD